jgi:hypothetical protein
MGRLPFSPRVIHRTCVHSATAGGNGGGNGRRQRQAAQDGFAKRIGIAGCAGYTGIRT